MTDCIPEDAVRYVEVFIGSPQTPDPSLRQRIGGYIMSAFNLKTDNEREVVLFCNNEERHRFTIDENSTATIEVGEEGDLE